MLFLFWIFIDISGIVGDIWVPISNVFYFYFKLATFINIITRMGLNIKQAAYAVKKYTSNCQIPANIHIDINVDSQNNSHEIYITIFETLVIM